MPCITNKVAPIKANFLLQETESLIFIQPLFYTCLIVTVIVQQKVTAILMLPMKIPMKNTHSVPRITKNALIANSELAVLSFSLILIP